MTEPYTLVVGGGPAGVGAAVTLAEAGENVLLVEQRDKLGGAVFRQPGPNGGAVSASAGMSRQWRRLMARFDANRNRIKTSFSSVFIGFDGDERFLFDRTAEGRTFACRPSAVIVAMGASERIRPFEGWQLPGVMTAGGAQMLLKEMGTFPEGRILVAGSGPLLIAIAAQMARSNRAPVAVLESGAPWSKPAALPGLLMGRQHLRDAVGYCATLMRSGIRIKTGARVLSARPSGDGLQVEVQQGSSRSSYDVDYLLVHDGIYPTHFPSLKDANLKAPVVFAGDGREILGAYAAPVDGERAAREALKRLGRPAGSVSPAALESARRFQKALDRLFASDPPPISPETVVCFCEQKRASELVAFGADASAREVRLVGRFGMGSCQGRFCRRTLQSLDKDIQVSTARWPIRPVSVGSLAALPEHDLDFLEFFP